ncbi:DUF1223 domain-containing protein [Hyphococcus sp. DH-69]|uniref:DUF1223 domain-containing protein n=1 Tax=Hyphococcus formosus TaxID=3143534 RepID=UPI00398B2E65
MSIKFRDAMKFFGGASAALFALGVSQLPAVAADSENDDIARPIVVELFLSQACIRCPKAAALLPRTAARDDVIALSWHVDYWNMTNTENGTWVDPFSKPEFTARQKLYNANIRHRSSIYTPQIVVNGQMETVGAKADKIDALLEKTEKDVPSITATIDGDMLTFNIGKSDEGGNAYLVTFDRHTSTAITSGGNAGLTFDGYNVVTDMKPLGVVRRRGGTLRVEKTWTQNEGCALIVQSPKQGAIVTAAYCPA